MGGIGRCRRALRVMRRAVRSGAVPLPPWRLCAFSEGLPRAVATERKCRGPSQPATGSLCRADQAWLIGYQLPSDRAR